MGTALMSNDSASCPYEIGDGFWTKNTTPPSERWPGTTWKQLKDTFLLSSGNTYSVGQTGGEATHTLVLAELPSIQVSILDSVDESGAGFLVPSNTFFTLANRATPGQHYWWSSSLSSDGTKDQPHNNMPPYTVRSYWERTG